MSHGHPTMHDSSGALPTLFAAGTSWGAAIVEWVTGSGLINPASVIAAFGTLVGFVANYPRIRAGWPLLKADLRLLRRRLWKGRA